MNIHEYQAKEILKKFGVTVPNGIPIFSLDEIEQKAKLLKSNKIVLKAQIHAGGRGKAGGIKIVNNVSELIDQAKNLFGKKKVKNGRLLKNRGAPFNPLGGYIIQGSPTCKVKCDDGVYRFVARIGDSLDCGCKIVGGAKTVGAGANA